MRYPLYLCAFLMIMIVGACVTGQDEVDSPDPVEVEPSTSTMSDDELGARELLESVTSPESNAIDPGPTTNECHSSSGCTWCVNGSVSCGICVGWTESKCWRVRSA